MMITAGARKRILFAKPYIRMPPLADCEAGSHPDTRPRGSLC
jgi:hypothetical protein